MNRTLLATFLLCALGRGAVAGDAGGDLELEIDGAITEGAYGDALTLSEEAIQTYPARPRVWYLRGVALFEVARMREAADAFRQALRRQRDWPDATAKLATATWLLGDAEAAHALVVPALRRAPRHDELRQLREGLDMDVRCRRDFWRSGLDEKSPQWAAQHFLLDLKQGEYVRVLTSDIDSELLDRWLPGGGRTNVRTAVDELVSQVGRSLANQTLVPDLIGFAVSDEVRMEGQRAKVGVNVLLRVHATPELVAMLRDMGNSALSVFWLKGRFGEMLRALEPAQREKTLAALAEGYTLLGPIFVELVPRGEAWKVVDVTVPHLSSLSLAGLMDSEAKKRALPASVAAAPAVGATAAPSAAATPPPEEAASLDRSRLALMGAGGLVAGFLVFFLLRWRLKRSR